MDKFSRKLGKAIRARIDTSSLQFRLTFGIIIIFTLGLGSLAIWTGWEIKQLLIASYQAQSISTLNNKLLTILQYLQTISVLSIATTGTLATLFVMRMLLPLQQIAEWAQTEAMDMSSYPFKLTGMPREIKAIIQKWERLLARLSETKERQRQFTNDLAHELRTPLSLVYGYLQRTQQRSQNLSESQQESLAMAVAEAQRMTQLLQNWLDLERIGDRVIPLEMKPLVLNDLVMQITQMTEKFEYRTTHVRVPPFPVKVMADRERLMEVLNHLLGNAIKYSDAREPIAVQLIQSQKQAIVQVSDRGCGIPLSQQDRIFDPFYRVDPSRTRSTGGMGLGLSLVKRLVEGMGGEITVRSQPEEGSTFILRFPILGAKL
jgi:signal transduction histidine kinase